MLFLASAGWRIGDAPALCHEHQDLFRRRAAIRQGKTGHSFGTRLSETAMEAVHLAGTSQGFVFQSADGHPLSCSSATAGLHGAARMGLLTFRINPHKFRHTLAT